MSTRSKAVIITLAAQVIWGVSGPLVKTVLIEVPPLSLLFFRCLFVSVLMFPLFEFKLLPDLKKQLKNNGEKVTAEDKKNFFFAGFLGVFLNIALYFMGQKLTTVIDAWIITSAGVIFILAYSYFFRGERLSKVVYLGITLAFIGTVAIIGDGLVNFGRGGLLGNFLMLGSTLAAALSYFNIKDLVKKFSPMIIVYLTFLISLAFALPLFIWEFLKNPTWMAKVSISSWLIVAYLIFGSSVAAYYLSNKGLKNLSPSLSSTIGYASSIVAIGLSIIFLGERPTTYFFAGTGIIILGLILAETRHRNRNKDKSVVQ